MAKKSIPRDGCGHRKGVRGGGGYNSVFNTPGRDTAKGSLKDRLRDLTVSLGRR